MRESIGFVSSAPTMATGTIGVPRAQAQLHEAAAPEALEPVALLEELADALHPLGEDGDERLVLEQALGVLLAGAHGAEAVREAAEEREVEDEVLGEPAHARGAAGARGARRGAASSRRTAACPEWLATSRQRPSAGTRSTPWTSTRKYFS